LHGHHHRARDETTDHAKAAVTKKPQRTQRTQRQKRRDPKATQGTTKRQTRETVDTGNTVAGNARERPKRGVGGESDFQGE
jgi:hypothetical protein